MQPHQEGDLASFPVTPHAEGLTALQHADSALRLGEMPENANQKDFIRKGHSLQADREQRLLVHARRGARAGPPVRSFGPEFSAHSHEAARKLRAEIRRGVGSGAVQRPQAAQAMGEEEEEEGEEQGENAATVSGISLVTGPRRHAEVVLESEAVRGNLSGATGLSRLLALRSGAPSASAPAPEHHFYFGGSRAQKRRMARRVETLARAREANLALRKERLLEGNVEELERLSREYEEEAAHEAAMREEAAAAMREGAVWSGEPGAVPLPAGGEAGEGAAAPLSAPSASSTPVAWAVLGGLALILAGVAVFGARRRRRA